jgi:glycosyltransferase involved in cell wall biosynthesis
VYIRDNGLNECVDFAGTPDIHELVRLYNAADVLLSPSLYEGFGLTVVEAMACGTPVIASNTSSLPEITGDAAILTDPHDTESMVEAVCLLRGNAEYRQRLIGRGITQAKLFSWTETAERTAAVYERVIEERRCRRN